MACCSFSVFQMDVAAGLEEALIASLADAETASPAAAAPPASKRAVKSLLREQLSEARLQQLGGDGTQCAVCRSAISSTYGHCHCTRSPEVKACSICCLPACMVHHGIQHFAFVYQASQFDPCCNVAPDHCHMQQHDLGIAWFSMLHGVFGAQGSCCTTEHAIEL